MATSAPQLEFDPKVDPARYLWDRTEVRVSVVLFGIVLWLAAIVALFKSPGGMILDSDMTPEPEHFHYRIPDDTRALLSSEVRDFLAKMESGLVSGHLENEFRVTLNLATAVESDVNFRRYYFALGRNKIEEGFPIITVHVQRSTGRIFRCSLWTCCS